MNKEIALILGMSVDTVKTHLRSIFIKVGIESKISLVTRYAVEEDRKEYAKENEEMALLHK